MGEGGYEQMGVKVNAPAEHDETVEVLLALSEDYFDERDFKPQLTS